MAGSPHCEKRKGRRSSPSVEPWAETSSSSSSTFPSATASTIGFEPVENGFARRFPAESRHLERAYANFSRLVEDLILAEAGEKAKRWDVALEALLRAVRGHDLDWYLVGSASLAVRGLDVVPGDVDLAVDADGANQLADILSDALIEPTRSGPCTSDALAPRGVRVARHRSGVLVVSIATS